MTYLNAHCHLELSFLAGKIPPGLPFVEWLNQVILARRSLSTPEARAVAAQCAVSALRKMQQDGTELLLDIDSLGIVSALDWRTEGITGLTVASYQELICFRPEQARPVLIQWQLKNTAKEGNGRQPLCSPHSPYTVCEPLLRGLGQQAPRANYCIHLAETKEENDFLVRGTGPLREFFDHSGALPPGWKAPGVRPLELLDRAKLLTPSTLLVHCNHLTDQELALIANRGSKVVVCPGTHVYFGRGAFPLKRLQEAGIQVYLGTDSLASNEELSMEREIRLACELAPELNRHWIRSLALAGRGFDWS